MNSVEVNTDISSYLYIFISQYRQSVNVQFVCSFLNMKSDMQLFEVFLESGNIIKYLHCMLKHIFNVALRSVV